MDSILLLVTRLTLTIVDLDESLESKFWDRVNADPLEHYFFILDRKMNPMDTRFLLAMRGDRIEGMMLIYRQTVFQVRGSREGTEALLDHLNLEKAEGSVPLDCRDLVSRRFSALKEHEIILMHLQKGNESLFKKCRTTRLTEADAEDVTNLIRGADPDM